MAEKKPKQKSNSVISNLVSYVQNGMNNLYNNTYFTQNTNNKDLETIKGNIDTSIDSIINNNINSVGIPNVSKLYNRMLIKNSDTIGGDKKIIDEIENLFGDKNITDGLLLSYSQNRYLKEFDEEIDIICKYMPQLEDALDAKKDNVLSADHFSKDFINVINKSNVKEDTTFAQRVDTLKKEYNLLEFFEKCYDNTAKYGEQFIYVIPYAKALKKLLDTKNGNINSSIVATESANLVMDGKIKAKFDTTQGVILTEGTTHIEKMPDITSNIGKLEVELNVSGILESAVEEYNNIRKIKQKTKKNDSDDSDLEGIYDGIITDNPKEKDKKIEIPGCMIKKLKRENIIPIYIEELCLGYYYLEYDYSNVFENNSSSDPMLTLKAGRMNLSEEDIKKDNMMKYLSGYLSSFIDSKFVNSNQDLRKEIYMILKHNELMNDNASSQIKITFIPPEDIVHMYFDKDEKTNRGISDLEKSLLPAKLYTSLYITNTIGVLTRGQDKRVYYVKQNIDTNISQTLLNTINQIKKSNFGARELSSVKNILNITGKYNDYVIPLGPTGDAPVQFEIMQGQNIETKTELMNTLEQMAINGTDVPYEFIQARQTVDYAVRLTMSNGKFLRKVFKRQAKTERFFSVIMTKVYNSEFEEEDELEVVLPPPAFLNITNTNQMIQNTNEYVASLVEMETADEQDEEFKAIFARKLKRHYLSTYLDTNAIESLKQQAKMEATIKRNKTEQ